MEIKLYSFDRSITEEQKKIIEDEVSYFQQTIGQLQKLFNEANSKFIERNELARDLNIRLVSTSRDEDRAMLASDEAVARGLSGMKLDERKSLAELIHNPYFGRIVVREDFEDGTEKIFNYAIGKHSNLDCRIIDWKTSPVSKLYYDYKQGDYYTDIVQNKDRNGLILLKRRVKIRDGKLLSVSSPEGDFYLEDNVWKLGITKSGKRIPDRVEDLYGLITKEQFELIKSELDTPLVIQGVAGSGKTTVACFRLAQLCLSVERDSEQSEPIFIVKSDTLSGYVKRILNALGCPNIKVETYSNWLSGIVKNISFIQAKNFVEEDDESISYLFRFNQVFIDVAKEYIDNQRINLINFIERTIPEKYKFDLLSYSEQLKESFLQLKQSKIGILDFAKYVDGLKIQFKDELHAKICKSLISRSYNVTQDIISILKDEDYISRRFFIGAKQEIFRLAEDFNRRYESSKLTTSDLTLLLAIIKLKTVKPITSFLNQKDHQYVTVDETQDLAFLELFNLANLVKKQSSLTLVGDLGQQIYSETNISQWLGGVSPFYLSVSHRSTYQIMNFAESTLGEGRKVSGRKGDVPKLFILNNENVAVRELINYIKENQEKQDNDLITIVARTSKYANYLFSLLRPSFGSSVRRLSLDNLDEVDGITVAGLKEVKGLEFPHVILWDVGYLNYPDSQLGRKALYVGSTRAEEQLTLFGFSQISPLISKRSNLVEVYEESYYEEQNLSAEEHNLSALNEFIGNEGD